MYDWTSIRDFLLTARLGSTLKAAQALGVNQTTVMRRLRQLEADLGLSLFHRHQQGYRLSAEGQELLPLAEEMERQAEALGAKARERGRQLKGTLSITATELAAVRLLAPALPAIRQQFPDVSIKIVTTDARLDLQRGEADIAIRAGGANEQPGIVRQRLPDSVWAIYGGRALLETMGEPAEEAALARYPVIAGDGPLALAEPLVWLERQAGEGAVVHRSNSLPGLLAATKAGLGLCALPALAAGMEDGLGLCGALRRFPSPVWLCYHETRKADPVLRPVAAFLAEQIRQKRQLLEGS